MKLLDFLFKTERHRKLSTLLWVDNLAASVREFSLLSGLPYATTHELLQKIEKMDLIKKTKQGRATLFSSNLSNDDLKLLKNLLGKSGIDKRQSLADFSVMDLPLVGEFPELQKEKAQSNEELLVKLVVLGKDNTTLFRTLPLVTYRLGAKLDFHHLQYWSKRYHVARELGFLLDLTSQLTGNRKYAALAKKLRDKRWFKQSFFLNSEKNLKGLQAKLVEQNTPDLAKKWFLKMNMGLDSFESNFMKFA